MDFLSSFRHPTEHSNGIKKAILRAREINLSPFLCCFLNPLIRISEDSVLTFLFYVLRRILVGEAGARVFFLLVARLFRTKGKPEQRFFVGVKAEAERTTRTEPSDDFVCVFRSESRHHRSLSFLVGENKFSVIFLFLHGCFAANCSAGGFFHCWPFLSFSQCETTSRASKK